MEANGVSWPDPPNPPVFIDSRGIVDEILKLGVLEAELVASGLEALGIVIDANSDVNTRSDDLREWCRNDRTD